MAKISLRLAKLLFLALGLALLAKVVSDADLAQVAQHLARVGWGGVALVLALHVVTFWTDVAGWQLTFTSIPLAQRWMWRLYAVRLAGEAFNTVLPAASIGGEPVKALLLKTHYRVGYREATATIVLARTVNTIALIVFLGAGFALLLASPSFSPAMKVVAGVGLAALGGGTGVFFLVQWFRIGSLTGRRVLKTRFGQRLERAVHVIHDIDEHIVQFYRESHLRFAIASTLGFTNWVLGVVEVYYVMKFLGHPVSFADAWIIEAMAQMMRTGTFFIPASIGVQEGTFAFVCRAITGSGETGVAMAAVRRAREIIWIALGLTLYWLYSLRRPAEAL